MRGACARAGPVGKYWGVPRLLRFRRVGGQIVRPVEVVKPLKGRVLRGDLPYYPPGLLLESRHRAGPRWRGAAI